MGGFMKMKGLAALIGIGTTKAGNTGGALVNMKYCDVFKNPLATSTSAATSLLMGASGAGQLLAAGITVPTVFNAIDFPRNLTVWADGACTSIISFTGTDQFGNVITEDITCNGAAIVAGTKVFATITACSCAAFTVGAQTVTVGQGSILGSSRQMNGLMIDGAVYTTSSGLGTAVQETTRPVKAPTAAVYGVTFNTAIAVTKTYVLSYGSNEVR
jgi:hypothetical protein